MNIINQKIMKRILLFAAMVLPLFATSCNKHLDYPDIYPDYYSFVTAEVKDGALQRFYTDDGRSLVAENGSNIKIADNQRAVIYFDLVNKEDKDKEDALIRVIDIDMDVVVAKSAIVADENAAKALGDNGTSVNLSPNRPQITSKYFNIYLGFNSSKPEKHEFTMAYIESTANDTKVLDLAVCHNDNGDSSANEWWTWVSFPVDEFASLYEGKDKVRINIKTRMSGIQTIELPVPTASNVKRASFFPTNE